jgi:uncharacterized OB-fold protein
VTATDVPAAEPPAEGAAFAEYWQALAQNRLVAQHCKQCDTWQWPARDSCRGCRGEQLEWAEVEPHGRVHTYLSVDRAFHPAFAAETPYTLVLVEVRPGVRYLGRLVEAVGRADQSVIGLSVDGRFRPHGEHSVLLDWAPSRFC